MALPTISTSDFTGDIKLSQNSFRTADLQIYINTYYPEIVADLLGEAALQEIEDASPLPDKYTDLLQGSGVYLNIEEDTNKKKPEVVEMVKRILYLMWLRDGNDINTPAGQATNKSENAAMLTRNQVAATAKQRYNWAVAMFNCRAIPFIENYTDYESDISSTPTAFTYSPFDSVIYEEQDPILF